MSRRALTLTLIVLLSITAGAGAMRLYLDPCVAAAHDVTTLSAAAAALFTPGFNKAINAVPTQLGDEFATCRARQ